MFSSADKCCSQGNVAIFDQVFNEIECLLLLGENKDLIKESDLMLLLCEKYFFDESEIGEE